LEIDSEKVKTQGWKSTVKKVEKFRHRYSTKKVKNNDYTNDIKLNDMKLL